MTGSELEDVRGSSSGLGAAGVAVSKILHAGRRPRHHRLRLARRASIPDRADYLDGSMNALKRWYAEHTNHERCAGAPADVIEGADLFIGLSGARILPAEALGEMNADPMVFAMANPTPEIAPEEAAQYARIMATGRSDYPNQINNVLCLPGHLPRRARRPRARINEEMKIAAAEAIAAIVPERRAARGLHHPVGLQPRRRARGRRGRRRARARAPRGHGRARDRLRRRDAERRYGGTRPGRGDAPQPRLNRVTVTGATGLIGPKLVAELVARGDEVTVLSRNPDKARAGLPGGVEAVGWADPPPPRPGRPGRPRRGRPPGRRARCPALERRVKQAIRESREAGTRNLVAGIAAADPRPGR